MVGSWSAVYFCLPTIGYNGAVFEVIPIMDGFPWAMAFGLPLLLLVLGLING